MCLFCKIGSHEIPSYKIYEDELFLAFLDINPTSKGHTLVIPKKHFANIFELDQETSEKMFKVVTYLARKISETLGTKNINILNNNGPLAGQTVEHFHIHIIPRYENDQVNFSFTNCGLSANDLSTLQKHLSLSIE